MRLKMLLHWDLVQLLLAQLDSGQANILAWKLFNYFHLALGDVTEWKNFILPAGQYLVLTRSKNETDQFAVSNLKLISIVLTEVQCVFEYTKWMEIRQRQTLSRILTLNTSCAWGDLVSFASQDSARDLISVQNQANKHGGGEFNKALGRSVLNFGSCLISKVTKAICYWTQLWPIDQ